MSVSNLTRGLKLLYTGKAKSLYQSTNANEVIMTYRNDATAFNALKHAEIQGKGRMNNLFNAHIMTYLKSKGIETHFLKLLDEEHSLVRKVDIIPVECIVRNIAAGSICKRLGVERGLIFDYPLIEFCYKSDALSDPIITEDHAVLLGWASLEELKQLKKLSLQVNEILSVYFDVVGIQLIDFKLEFGRTCESSDTHSSIILADEVTPDGCRLWDKSTGMSMDKDLFREDKGDLLEGYVSVARKIGVAF